jgi:periplasmic protein CpxP/Spy
MMQLIEPARGLAAASFLCALLAGSPLYGATPQPAVAPMAVQLAQATPAPSAPAPSASQEKPRRSAADHVEARIKSLHDRLKITSGQESQWSAVAQVMRDSAQATDAAMQRRHQAQSMTAIDDLKAYQAIADAHSQGLQKLIPAFQALHDTMSDEQKKNADAIFGQSRRGMRQKRSK